MTKVTLITDSDEIHNVESDDIRLDDSGMYTWTVVFETSSVLPDVLRGTSYSTVKQWEIIATDDGMTVSGQVRTASPMRLQFNDQF